MPRKKIAKRVVNKAASIATVAQMEKDFSSMPAKLTIEVNKELAVLKKKEAELKKAIVQTSSQLKATETRIKSVAKTKQSAAGKKQLAAAKKALQEAAKIHRGLINELNLVVKNITNCNLKLTKLKALDKALTQFDKDWAKKAKLQNKKIKAKTKRKPKKTARLKVVEKNRAESHSNIESLDTSVENVSLDQPAEMAS